MVRLWFALGSLAGLTAVAMAAAGAHALGDAPPATLRVMANGVEMHGWHALALLATGLWAERRPNRLVDLAGGAFTLGLLLFCGAVYRLALTGASSGAVAPTGGLLLMLGWLLLGASALRR